jgi:hypothetical protein
MMAKYLDGPNYLKKDSIGYKDIYNRLTKDLK